MRCTAIVALLLWTALVQARASEKDGWISLFNGRNLEGWYSFLLTSGKNNDPKGIFKVEDGMIHVLGVNDPLERRESYGYLATDKEYSDVRVRLEYKWGTRRFPPGSDGKKNSGLIYLIHAPDKMFPQALECQIQESDVGDVWMTDGISATSWVVDAGSSLYSDDNSSPGFQRLFGGPSIKHTRILKSGDFEDRSGWNTVEVVLEGDRATHIVNGRTVNRVLDIKQPDPQMPSHMIPLTQGRIALESEGAEIWFRNISIKPLKGGQ